MTAFFRFPHTPHLAWLGKGTPRDDKVLSENERTTILARDLVVEEKVDGANIGISVDDDGDLRVQNRGSYLDRHHLPPQFKPLFRWIHPHREALVDALWPDLVLFGEWCYAIHSVEYTKLPFRRAEVEARAVEALGQVGGGSGLVQFRCRKNKKPSSGGPKFARNPPKREKTREPRINDLRDPPSS